MCWCSTALQWQTPRTHTHTHTVACTCTHILSSAPLDSTRQLRTAPKPRVQSRNGPHAGRPVGTDDADGAGPAGESCEKGARTRRRRARPRPAFRYRHPADVCHWLVRCAVNSESESEEINADGERRPRWLGPQWRRGGSLLMGVSD